MNEKVLVFGKNGQVGSALQNLLGSAAFTTDRLTADFSRPETVLKILIEKDPDIVLNAVAYNAVDRAEGERALAFQINGNTPGILARWCAENGKTFVHYSTDYVFGGEGSQPWNEEHKPAPLSVYGESKLEGERLVIQEMSHGNGKYFIFRTSWVYDAFHSNFVTRMLKHAREKPSLKIINDQWGSPTYAPDIASFTLQALERASTQKPFPSGIYHLCNSGYTTFYQFFLTFYEYLKSHGQRFQTTEVLPVDSSAFPLPAKRPKNCRMSCEKLLQTFELELPFWKDSLLKCLDLMLKGSKT